MAGFNEHSLEILGESLAKGKAHPREMVESFRKRIETVEKCLSALNRPTYDAALGGLEKWCWTSDNPSCGIPYVQKDNICTLGIETNCSSRILSGFVPPYAATVEIRMREAGFRLIGKANMDEFGMGSSTEYSAWGPTLNPYDISRVAGGSSGGSAAAVAAGYAPLAFGTDTGGSVRQPAAFCGLVGLRPTYGRVSRWGLVAFASSLDQIGPITTTVRDSAHVLSIIEGPDKHDSTLVHRPKENYLSEIESGVGELRVGVLDAGLAGFVDPRVKAVFEENVGWFKGRAKTVKEIHLGTFDLLLAAYYVIAPSEASSNLARFDGIRYGPSVDLPVSGKPPDERTASSLVDFYRKNRSRGFGPEVTRRILIGTFALSSGYYDAYYLRAQKVRTRVRAELDELWKDFDVIISPTAPTPAFKLGSKLDDPMDMYREDVFVLAQPMAGCPAISINGGYTTLADDGVTQLSKTREKDCFGKAVSRLPIGLQITAPPFGESRLFRAARAFEREHA
jgi:aspartyl-tRNA(Asn)/glutamyl-tRNA(Gln) amidotransferase subunit A